MKNTIVKGLSALLTAGMLVGCSSDYLDVAPETEVSTSEVQTTEAGARYALVGACNSMYFPMMKAGGFGFPNGEPYVTTFYGDVLGQDYFSLMWASMTGGNYMWQANRLPDGWVSVIGWTYCYNLINQVNAILDGIDTIDGDRANLDFTKAQALTIRAHAYTRLLQVYAPRWKDSRDGEVYTVVLRLKSGIEDVPLFTMNDVLAQIYSDLETAESLFESCGKKRSATWEPDISVAKAIHARAALLKEDWATAQRMAHEARQGYPIMDSNEYRGGFCTPNKEWIWSAHENEFDCGFWSYGAMYACNGAYPGIWGFGAGAINYELYKKIPSGDVRAELFFTPDKLVGNKVSATSFWNEKWIQTTTMNLNSLNALMKNQIEAFQDRTKPTDPTIEYDVPYSNFQTKTNKDSYVVFGAQYKFWGKDTFGSGDFCIIRGAEMLLTEAEAAWHNNDQTTAINNLKELNAQRNENYTCNLSGDALMEEIMLQRRIELWGEGFSWFDLKRWNLPMVRNEWVQRDPNSNNVPRAYALRKEAGDKGWRFAVPMSESRYNKLVDRSLVDD